MQMDETERVELGRVETAHAEKPIDRAPFLSFDSGTTDSTPRSVSSNKIGPGTFRGGETLEDDERLRLRSPVLSSRANKRRVNPSVTHGRSSPRAGEGGSSAVDSQQLYEERLC